MEVEVRDELLRRDALHPARHPARDERLAAGQHTTAAFRDRGGCLSVVPGSRGRDTGWLPCWPRHGCATRGGSRRPRQSPTHGHMRRLRAPDAAAMKRLRPAQLRPARVMHFAEFAGAHAHRVCGGA